MSADIEEMAERIRAGLDPAPVCPYVKVHGPSARCPNCADWPRPDPARIAEKTARHAAAATEGTESFRLRLTRSDPDTTPRRLRWAARIALVLAGGLVMHAEGRAQPAPGVWFAVAMALFMGAAFIGSRHHA